MKTCRLPLLFILLSLPSYLLAQTNGNVGIGTPTPTARLQVNAKTNATNATLLLLDSVGGFGPTMRFRNTGSLQALSITGNTTGTDANKGIIMSWIDDSLLWLKPNGALGLGTNNPQARMQVNHRSTANSPTLMMLDSSQGIGATLQFRKQGSADFLGITGNTTGTDANKGIIMSWIDDSLLWLKPNGALGLGTNSPQARMQINHRSTANSPTFMMLDSAQGLGATLQFRKQGSADFLGITGNTTGTDANKGIIMSWIDDSLLWLKPNGALGLGTNNPQARMQVNHRSTANSPTFMMLDSAQGLGATLQFKKQGSADFLGITGNTTGTDANKGIIMSWIDDSLLWLKPNGALGLGTNNPQARMQVNHRSTAGNPAFVVLDSANGIGNMISLRKIGVNRSFGIGTTLTEGGANALSFFKTDIGGTETLLHLNANNNRVGINTTNPQATLDINGSLRIGVLIAGLTAGQPGQVLTSNGSNTPPSWEDIIAGGQDPDTIAFHVYENTPESVASGVNGQVMSTGGLERFDKGNGFNPANGFFDVFVGDISEFHFDAKVSFLAGTPDNPPFVARLSLEIVASDGTTVLRSAEENLFIPSGVPNGTPFTLRSSTTQQLDPDQKVRVRFSHNRGSSLNVKLEEFSGFSL